MHYNFNVSIAILVYHIVCIVTRGYMATSLFLVFRSNKMAVIKTRALLTPVA